MRRPSSSKWAEYRFPDIPPSLPHQKKEYRQEWTTWQTLYEVDAIMSKSHPNWHCVDWNVYRSTKLFCHQSSGKNCKPRRP